MPKCKFCWKKTNVQNFEPSNFDLMTNFDNSHGLATKCKKPDDELKTNRSFNFKIEFY